MFLRKFLDGLDEEAAAEEDERKSVAPCEIGASIAFPELPADADIEAIVARVKQALVQSEDYYKPDSLPADLRAARFDGEWLSFPSALPSSVSENNIVFARVFEGRKSTKAIILVPYWNGSEDALILLAKIFRALGYCAIVLTLPYHHRRKRPDSVFADYFVSANVGRTIHAVRQSVADVYGIVSWLQERGYNQFSILGASLGSCVAGIAGAFDPRIKNSLLFLTAGSFADVVWTGRATRHISEAFGEAITIDQLRAAWSIISLDTFAKKFTSDQKRVLMLSAKWDKVVRPEFARPYASLLRKLDVQIEHRWLSCGHYTMGRLPFSAMATWSAISFLNQPTRQTQ